MAYRAPVSDILFAMRHVAHLDAGIAEGIHADLGDGMAQSVLEEAAKFGEAVLAPLNRIGDLHGAKLQDGVVATAPGWTAAYRQFVDGGWNSLTGPATQGGQELPHLLGAACLDIWNGANMAFMLCPLLNFGAIDAVAAHGSDHLKAVYLPKMVSGEWTATMNLTEPQAGSDLALLRSKAERRDDGSYRIKGSKIYITYGEHDMTANIVIWF